VALTDNDACSPHIYRLKQIHTALSVSLSADRFIIIKTHQTQQNRFCSLTF